MCLAVPARVTQLIEPDQAEVDLGGVKNQISVALIEDVRVGDFVIVHVGFAISRLDVEEAERSIELFRQIAAAGGDADHALPD
jgi:hydrogenase expression/formation protein HypC